MVLWDITSSDIGMTSSASNVAMTSSSFDVTCCDGGMTSSSPSMDDMSDWNTKENFDEACKLCASVVRTITQLLDSHKSWTVTQLLDNHTTLGQSHKANHKVPVSLVDYWPLRPIRPPWHPMTVWPWHQMAVSWHPMAVWPWHPMAVWPWHLMTVWPWHPMAVWRTLWNQWKWKTEIQNKTLMKQITWTVTQ